MYPLPEGLSPSKHNKLDSYFPVRNSGNNFEWDVIAGLILSYGIKRQVGLYEFGQFRDDCKEQVVAMLDVPDFWGVIEQMYFVSRDIYKISPLFLLFKVQRKGNGKADLGAANWRIAELFISLMEGHHFTTDLDSHPNFIEQELLNVLSRKLEPLEVSGGKEETYLPYLAKAFQRDIAFLASHPQYLLQELISTLKLYAFSYCSQLALNVSAWKKGEPESKPLYFILDTEKASAERIAVQHYGYKWFLQSSKSLFPILSALEALQYKGQKRPLWRVYQQAINYPEHQKLLDDLNRYLQDFIEVRELRSHPIATTIEQAFDMLELLAMQQFQDEKTTRADVQKKYIKELEKQICSDFIQSRGRAGRVLVLNQDQLLLLTNLAIGRREKLRLHELMSEFKQRGFYLDNQSRQVLVTFYERMGNVERMSDSGDAIYVRKTV